jgi:hypothetical protein
LNLKTQRAALPILAAFCLKISDDGQCKPFLFVIVVAMVATGLHLFVAGLFFTSETNIWYVVSGGWLIGLGGDRLWRDFVAPFLVFEAG